jgi:hypothetical protein
MVGTLHRGVVRIKGTSVDTWNTKTRNSRNLSPLRGLKRQGQEILLSELKESSSHRRRQSVRPVTLEGHGVTKTVPRLST